MKNTTGVPPMNWMNCRDELRQQKARDAHLNGIDFIEVNEVSPDGVSLCAHLFGDVPETISKANVRIEGGRRIRGIKVLDAVPHDTEDETLGDCLRVTLDKEGDFSTYCLCLVEVEDGRQTDRPLQGFDPRYSCAEFSFRTACPSSLDCGEKNLCSPETHPAPEINYLAKDYASFRQLIFDRMALLMPEWKERHVPDIGIALVELLAYVGDHLSYFQDAVATEAYLDTARQRISVRRHARLVDYQMSEGCNARAFVHVRAGSGNSEPLKPGDIYFITRCEELMDFDGGVINEDELQRLSDCRYEAFEPLVADPEKEIRFYEAHNEIHFYNWGDEECCLPRGATRATLKDGDPPQSPGEAPSQSYEQRKQARRPKQDSGDQARPLRLNKGDILIFQEALGPKTGAPDDADLTRRHAVRLTAVEPNVDPLNGQPVLEIEWAAEDALPFPLCVSAKLTAPECDLKENVSVALGNVIMVDHGRSDKDDLGKVETGDSIGECVCDGAVKMIDLPAKFKPFLESPWLTFGQPVNFESPASLLLEQDPRLASPRIKLIGEPARLNEPFDETQEQWHWLPQRDLLGSNAADQHFVVEIDNDGRAHLRFGDGELGRQPSAGMTFTARFRAGNGKTGNVGAEAISLLVTRFKSSGLNLKPRNPMPARGGVDAEPISEVKLFAPGSFRKTLARAITAGDYGALAQKNPKAQRAAGRMRWTGSWYEACVAVDPFGAEEADKGLIGEIKGFLHRYRRMGHDLVVKRAAYVPLDIELAICVKPNFLRGHVEEALRNVFSNRVLPGGKRGYFHPDNLTFGEGIYLSKLVAGAQAVEGVESVEVKKLERLFVGPNGEIASGILPLEANEIARLDNDPNFPEHGRLKLKLRGGR